jgi:hypothetical protein
MDTPKGALSASLMQNMYQPPVSRKSFRSNHSYKSDAKILLHQLITNRFVSNGSVYKTPHYRQFMSGMTRLLAQYTPAFALLSTAMPKTAEAH